MSVSSYLPRSGICSPVVSKTWRPQIFHGLDPPWTSPSVSNFRGWRSKRIEESRRVETIDREPSPLFSLFPPAFISPLHAHSNLASHGSILPSKPFSLLSQNRPILRNRATGT